MIDSEGTNKRKFGSDRVGLALISSLAYGTEISSHDSSITQNIATRFGNRHLNPLVINPNPFCRNFPVVPSPVFHPQTTTRPCRFIPYDHPIPISVPNYPKHSLQVINTTSSSSNASGRKPSEDCIFEIPSPRTLNSNSPCPDPSNFLKHCYICNKSLQGEDIYMYRDNGFCSEECREQKYISDCAI